MRVNETARKIWLDNNLPLAALNRLHLSDQPDNAINSSFRLAEAAQTIVGLAGLAAAHFHELATGIQQSVTVNPRHAVLHFHSEAWYTINGSLPQAFSWDSIAGLYRTRNGGFIRIHTNFPHHRKGILDILKIPDTPDTTKEDVAAVLRQWDAYQFEEIAAEKGMCATALRSFADWDQHPHALALLGVPPVTIIKVGEGPRRVARASKDSLPLDGIRVLDLSRVLAGPVAGRMLAAHGADVLLVTSPNLPSLPSLDVDTSLGKRTTQLDLTTDQDRQHLFGLLDDADVFLQAYRPGALDAKGFGVKELASRRPGIVCANLSAWGWDGPWKDRRGFDSLVQTATGFNHAEGQAFSAFSGENSYSPRTLPMQALDHAAGYLLAFGVQAALCKTLTEGGSWEVRVSLAGVGQWIRSLGQLHPTEAFGEGTGFPRRVNPLPLEVRDLSTQCHPVDGITKMTALRPAAILSMSPSREPIAPLTLNSDPRAVWL